MSTGVKIHAAKTAPKHAVQPATSVGVNIHTAKTTLSKLVEKVQQGETIIISKAGKPVAQLGPLPKQRPERKFGTMKGKIKVLDPNWWKSSMTETEIDQMYNEDWWL